MATKKLAFIGNTSIISGLGTYTTNSNLTRLETALTACAQNVLDNHNTANLGIILSSTKGNIALLDTNFPNENSPIFLHNMAKNVCQALNLPANPIIISNACTSGVCAIIIASRLIQDNIFDDVLVIGGDEITDFTTSGFQSFKSISKNNCRPYDANRDGLSLGEAVAAILVTSNYQKSTGISIIGGAMTNDANHISGPSRTGEPLAQAIKSALSQAHISPSDLNMINAHGTATIYNDEMEAKAFNLLALNNVPLNSLKPYFGHTLGASGVLEIALCIEQMKQNIVAATPNFSSLGVPFPLNISSQNRYVNINFCLKTASGFGGTNAAIILAKSNVQHNLPTNNITPKITKSCSIHNSKILLNNNHIYSSSLNFHDFSRDIYHNFCQPYQKFFKMDDFCKLGFLTNEILLKDEDNNNKRRALVFATTSGSLMTDIEHNRTRKEIGASPSIFVYTLPNIVLGEIAIRHKIQGETTMFIMPKYNESFLQNYATFLIKNNFAEQVLIGYLEFTKNDYLATIKILS